MTTTTAETSPLLDALRESLGSKADAFVEAGLPTQRSEDYRYVTMRRLRTGSFTAPTAPPADPGRGEPFAFRGLEARRVVLVNGFRNEALSTLHALPRGVRLTVDPAGRLADFVPETGPGARRDFFWNLNTAFARPLVHLDVPAGVHLADPVHFVLRSLASAGATPIHSGRILVTLGEGASATVLRTTESSGAGAYLANYHVQYELAAGAKLVDHVLWGDPDESFTFASTQIALQAGATCDLVSISFGSRITRHLYRVDLLGEGGSAELAGTEAVGGDREFHKHITVHHRAPRGHSNQHFKTILGQQANASYDGAILVDEVAQKTDAFQLGGNLMLSDEAKAHVKPSLYIHADDVKCSHGGTCGQLEEEELHYIQTRGISRAEARRLMITAFAIEVLDRIRLDAVREECVRRLRDRLVGLDEAGTVGLSARRNRAKKK